MLANHTSIHTLFERILLQYTKLKSRNAFVTNYTNTNIFGQTMDEFINSEEVVTALVEEYKAAEHADYVNWGMSDYGMADIGYP